MRRIFTTLGIAAVLSLGAAPTAFAVPGDQVCADLGSGKIDTAGNPSTVTLTAPAGMVITGYCVKAGSAKQGDGPVYVELPQTQWAASITISHPSGKAVSHYSFATGAPAPAPNPAPAPAPKPEPEPAPKPEPKPAPKPAPAPAPEAPAQGPGAPAPANPAPEGPAQGPGAPAPAPETPTRALGAPASGAPAQSTGAAATPTQTAQSLQQIADGRAVNNQGLNVQSAGIDASPAQSPVVIGGVLALLMTAGFWTLRKSLAKQ